MNPLGVPTWFFVSCMVFSLALGVGLRRYLTARKKRLALEEKEWVKDVRKQAKMQRRRAKKAAKALKGKKPVRDDGEAGP